jgi:hypothetical protein
MDINEEKAAEFIINEVYQDLDVIPLSCILTGSRAYGLSTDSSDRDHLAVHIMDTWYCLEHPDYRQGLQLISREYVDEDGSEVSIQSFEMWKFISLFMKGGFNVYEILYMPEIHHDPGIDGIIAYMREGLTTKIGHSAIGNCVSTWKRAPDNRKKIIMSYYRLLQAILFLREEEFEWEADALWEYGGNSIPSGQALLKTYMNKETRKDKLSQGEIYFLKIELEMLVGETNKAMMASMLPDKCPKEIRNKILEQTRKMRGNLI